METAKDIISENTGEDENKKKDLHYRREWRNMHR